MTKTKLLLLLVILNITSQVYASSKADRLQIKKVNDFYVLSVPVSRLIMDIPLGSLTIGEKAGGSTQSPRYFNFYDKANGLVISGWFEPEHAFSGINQFWKAETASWKQRGLPSPQNTTFTKIGNWDSIIYDVEFPSGNNSHIRAHWLQAGTWIDIHLSITNSLQSETNRKKLNQILATIKVKVQSDYNLVQYSLPKHGLLEVSLPALWEVQIEQPPDDLPPTIIFGPKSDLPFEMLITPVWQMEDNQLPWTSGEIEQIVKKSAIAAQSQALEKTIKIISFEGSMGKGFYFSATDRNPGQGEFKYLTQGMINIGQLAITFTILTNENQESIKEMALNVIKGIHHKHAT